MTSMTAHDRVIVRYRDNRTGEIDLAEVEAEQARARERAGESISVCEKECIEWGPMTRDEAFRYALQLLCGEAK